MRCDAIRCDVCWCDVLLLCRPVLGCCVVLRVFVRVVLWCVEHGPIKLDDQCQIMIGEVVNTHSTTRGRDETRDTWASHTACTSLCVLLTTYQASTHLAGMCCPCPCPCHSCCSGDVFRTPHPSLSGCICMYMCMPSHDVPQLHHDTTHAQRRCQRMPPVTRHVHHEHGI